MSTGTQRRAAAATVVTALWALGASVAGCHDPTAGLDGWSLSSNVDDWRDEVIYQIVVDRFDDGDSSNNHRVDRAHMGRYHGGDWQGIIDRIPYLQQLGVTAVWISPVVRNVEHSAGFDGYHGYWPQDFTRVNPHFGDLAQLRRLVDALHQAGIKVIGDIVVNHIGPLFYYDINGNGRADDLLHGSGGPGHGSANADAPGNLTRVSEWEPAYDSRGVQGFSSLGESGPAPIVWANDPAANRVPAQPGELLSPSWYHRRGRITVWENRPRLGQPPCEQSPDDNVELCEYVREQELLGDLPGGLRDLATELPEVQRALIDIHTRWIELADFDGLRIDTLKHLDHGFVRAFCAALRRHAAARGKQRLLLLGEAFSGADRLLGSYTDEEQVDSVFYFSQKYRVIDEVFQRGGPTTAIEQLHRDRAEHYSDRPQPGGAGVAPRELLVNFLDNHDLPRFLHRGNLPALHNALVYLLTTIGVPCIYYGTEQRFAGGSDPANREDMWRGNPDAGLLPFDTDNETFRLIRTLIAIRKAYAPLRRGDLVVRWTTTSTADEPDAGLFAFERTHEGQTVLVVLNTSDCDASRPSSSRTSLGSDQLQSSFGQGTELVNVLPEEDRRDRFVVGAGGRVEVEVPCRGAKILVPESLRQP